MGQYYDSLILNIIIMPLVLVTQWSKSANLCALLLPHATAESDTLVKLACINGSSLSPELIVWREAVFSSQNRREKVGGSKKNVG